GVPVGCAVRVHQHGRGAVVPQYGILRGGASDRKPTAPRDPDNLPAIIEGSGGAGGVARHQREFPNLVPSRSPGDWLELQYLRYNARWIVHGILRPASRSSQIVGAGRKAVSPAEGRQWPHLARQGLPHESETGIEGRIIEEESTAPALPVWIQPVSQ